MSLTKCPVNNCPPAQSAAFTVLPEKQKTLTVSVSCFAFSISTRDVPFSFSPLAFIIRVQCLMRCSSFFSLRDLSKHDKIIISVALYSLMLLFPVSTILTHFCPKYKQSPREQNEQVLWLCLRCSALRGVCCAWRARPAASALGSGAGRDLASSLVKPAPGLAQHTSATRRGAELGAALGGVPCTAAAAAGSLSLNKAAE